MSMVSINAWFGQTDKSISDLGVPGFMFECHKEYTGHLARQRATTGLQFSVEVRQASPNTLLEVEDG